MFGGVVAYNTWLMLDSTTVVWRVLFGAMAALFVYLTTSMALWLQDRRQGRRRIILRASALTSPHGIKRSTPSVEIRYVDIRRLEVTAGSKSAIRIEHGGGLLEIARYMLGSDAEFDELAAILRQRAAHAPAAVVV